MTLNYSSIVLENKKKNKEIDNIIERDIKSDWILRINVVRTKYLSLVLIQNL
jgi:hypothetical protein